MDTKKDKNLGQSTIILMIKVIFRLLRLATVARVMIIGQNTTTSS